MSRSRLVADLDLPIGVTARELADHIAWAFGDATMAVLHYGSQTHHSPAPTRATFDFFVIIEDARRAYESFASSLRTGLPARTATRLSSILSPNILGISLPGSASTPARGKCIVLSLDDLRLACSPQSRDHFTKGRLFQSIRLAYFRDPASRACVEDALLEARRGTFGWVRAYLPPTFDTAEYCRTLLAVSYGAEIRAENKSRSAEVFSAQRNVLVPMYQSLLDELAEQRCLRAENGVYVDASPPSAGERLRIAAYFARSKARAVARWGKSIILYDDWFEYLIGKARRRGMHVPAFLLRS